MQSVCALFPAKFFRRIIDLRAELCEDPALGAIYDPPFVHMTLQLAEEYDWPSLESALVQVAQQHQPFDVRTVGVLAFTGKEAGISRSRALGLQTIVTGYRMPIDKEGQATLGGLLAWVDEQQRQRRVASMSWRRSFPVALVLHGAGRAGSKFRPDQPRHQVQRHVYAGGDAG